MVVSASRRTDVPAFFTGWFLRQLRRGRAAVPNPVTGRPYLVDLRPERVHSIVLWSKDYGRLLPRLDELASYRLFFHLTVNGYGPELEPLVPPAGEAVRQARALAAARGAEVVAWRFDPVVFDWRAARRGEPFPGAAERLETFARLCADLAGAGVRRCTVAFLKPYRKVRCRLRRLGLEAALHHPSPEEKRAFVRSLLEVAEAHGVGVRACCEEELAGLPGLGGGGCVDGRLLGELFGEPASTARHAGQQGGCRCTVSADVGAYEAMPCAHDCRYCYACPVSDRLAAGRRRRLCYNGRAGWQREAGVAL